MIPAKGVGAIIAPLLLCAPAFAQAQLRTFDIAEQPAVTGIPEFARQAGLQIVSPISQLGHQKTRAVRGRYPVDAALAKLLRGTGLRVVMHRDNVVGLALAEKAASTPEFAAKPRPAALPLRHAPATQPHADAAPQIIVTGTRIARPGLESAMPVAVVDAASARSFGYNTVYGALTLNPAIGPGLGIANSQGDTWEVGVSNINLRNMGVNRSLVLVDGRRWVSGGARTSAVDLNSIPDAMIDRFEVVTGGAAAIYGADAVTGAINIITKKNVTGLHLSATNGLSTHGDASQPSLSATTGFRFGDGRGSFELGGTFTHTSLLRYSDRYTDRVGYVPNPASTGPHDGIPDNILDTNIRYLQRSSVPTIYYNNQWYILNEGTLGRTGYDYVITPGALGSGHGGAGATAFENHLLRDKLVLGSLYSRLAYDLSSALSWSATLSYAHSYARAPTVFPEARDDTRATNWWGGTTGGMATLTNPFLPDSLRQFMLANGLTSLPLNRTYSNLPQPFEIHERDYGTVGTALDGRLSGRLTWSAFFQLGQTSDHVTTTNMIRHTEWLFARDAIADPATGRPVCANAAARAAGCVPFDLFTTEPPSRAFLDYVAADRHERRSNALYTAGATVNGGLFSLPYGEVKIAAGAEWRRETLSTRDDPDTAKLADIVFKPGVDYVLHPGLDAARDTTEVYGELVVPLLGGLPLAHALQVEGAYRFSHYSDEPGTGTWKAGATWQPFRGLTLRGVYSHSIRIPNFGELYSPQLIQTVGITSDPCSGVFITQGPNRARNCAALLPGLALPLPYPNTNAPTIYLGGNPDLTPERSNSFTFGTVLQPPFLTGFDLTVDYWDIRIANVITALPYLNVLNLCVDSSSGIANFCCGLVTRGANGQIVSILASNYNLATQRARGVDFGASYRRSLGPGRARLQFNGTYLIEQTNIGSPGTDAIDYAGQWNYPRFRATLTADYSIGKVTFGLNSRFISRSAFDVTDASAETRDPSRVPAYLYHDVTVEIRPSARYSLTFGIKNVGNAGIFGPLQDTAPGPNSSGGVQTGAAYYDAVGRYFFTKVAVSF
ncbi:TonB-dependent receptor [Sphingomonas sp. AP4-R1]|uniref:TonB-dependent receptor n=1 Tax=Sphingomonas sp. AP4-R1 TaxID=2735134 RepID=UPI0014937F1B|nr:TonB-dependent receptor [Sphingomonas sp. AP4-R1]QJU59929.1 TonB-dependent receptor [Sphingomonas sp. AP4-R1]